MDVKTSESPGRQFPPAALPPAAVPAAESNRHRPPPLPPDRPRVLIEAEDSGVRLNLAELWAARELLYFLTLRDVKVRYKQTLMGVAWVIIQPLFTMLIFTLVFNKFARLDAGALPYPLFAYSGLLLWVFFSNAVVNSTNSLVNNTNLVTKVYFPRVFIPAAAVAAGMIDLLIASVMLLALAIYYGVAATWGLLLLPLFVTLTFLLALGVGMLVSALSVKYRDLKHALPFVMQFWMFASPVIYPSGLVPEGWRWLLVVNPLAGILEGFRAALAGGGGFDWPVVSASAVLTLLLLIGALYVFRRAEDTFADLI